MNRTASLAFSLFLSTSGYLYREGTPGVQAQALLTKHLHLK